MRKRDPNSPKPGCGVAHETDIYNNISAQTQVGIIERMLLRNDIEEKCGVRSVKTFSTYQSG